MEPKETTPPTKTRLSENLSIWTRLWVISALVYTGLSLQGECNITDTAPVFNVDSYGAKGNGVSDDSQAFLAAWNAACESSSDSVFLVPNGKSYLVKPINFNGPCKSDHLTAQISGRIIAPHDPCRWNLQERNEWLMFSKVQGLTINGGGIIDGTGQKWWDGDCDRDQNHMCLNIPTAFVVYSSSNVHLRDLKFRDSPKSHIEIAMSTHVQVENLEIVAPGDSPNTDGIHIYASQHVVIQNCTIATGDDCISIVTQSSDIEISKLVCGPGHGISIGSLGSGDSEDTVSDVFVNGASLNGTQNGVRIKTWQGGKGYAQRIMFQHVNMINVSNPIIIDQYYCAGPSPCKKQQMKPCNNDSSAVLVHNVTYTDITGTSATKEAIKLACSGSVPCTEIVMEGISLRLDNGDPATSFSDNVQGSSDGQVIPPVNFTSPGLPASN